MFGDIIISQNQFIFFWINVKSKCEILFYYGLLFHDFCMVIVPPFRSGLRFPFSVAQMVNVVAPVLLPVADVSIVFSTVALNHGFSAYHGLSDPSASGALYCSITKLVFPSASAFHQRLLICNGFALYFITFHSSRHASVGTRIDKVVAGIHGAASHFELIERNIC